MNRMSRQNQRAPHSLNQSMTNGLPALTSDNMNLCISQFYRRRVTQKYQDSPCNEIQSSRQCIPLTKDLEQLKEEIIDLKKENQKLRIANQQLHFQIKLDEKEQIDKKTTQDFSDDQLMNTQQNQRLIEKLKFARMLLNEKQIEIDQLKKGTRYMRVQEVENELLNTKLKFEILNKQFNEVLKTENDINKFQKLTIQIIESEERVRNLTLNQQKQKKKVLQLRQELLQTQVLREKFKKQYEECQNEFEKYKKNNEQETLRKAKYKEQIQSLHQVIDEKQKIIQQLQNEIEKLKLLVLQKQKQFKDLEDQYSTKKSWLTNKREADIIFQDILDDKVNKNQVKLNDIEIESSIKLKSETQIPLIDEPIPIQQIKMSFDSQIDDMAKSQSLQSSKKIPDIENVRQKMPRVSHYDVESIGKQIKYQLMSEQISYDQLDQYFSKKQTLNIIELVEILSDYPFNISDNKKALLLARYMIEDNTQQIVDFNYYQTMDICVIKSVLKNILGRYQLFDEDISDTIMNTLSQQIWKFRQSIIEYVKLINQKKNNIQSDYCDEDDFKNALIGSNIILDNKQKEFLGYLIYKEFGAKIQFDYRILIDKFNCQSNISSPLKQGMQQI